MPVQSTLCSLGPAPLTGIARLASLSPEVRERAEVSYFALPARSILNRGSNKRMPFVWTINPYRGCEFGCKYCYARYTHEFMEMRDGLDFERKIYAKVGAPELLRAELQHARDKGLPIALGTATDPYQPAEKQFGITRRLLEALAGFKGIRFSITTKSVLILRDLDLLKVMKDSVGVHMTVTTTSARLARLLEPKAPPPAKRLEAVARLVSEGIFAGINAMPILPGITDSRVSLDHLARHAAAAGAKFFHGNTLHLMPSSMRFFMPFLKQEFPGLVRRYQRLYARSAYLPENYQKEIAALVDELRERYGLNQTRMPAAPASGPAQMTLGFPPEPGAL
ncbi:MAG TPA: radical SAM protein [Terriglobia bacterium]|nr:radical SAM protein [Terriglobia bacterium]